MTGALLRLLWRVFVGFIAIILAYGTVFLFYPYLHDHHLPLLINLTLLYILIAYVGIPFLVRLWHFVLRPRHLPQYAVSADGWSSDPVNIAIVCRDKKQLQRAMQQAGWDEADKTTIKNSLHFIIAFLFRQTYPNAPLSRLYMFGRHQDIGFEIQTGDPPTPRHRHHIRFWQLDSQEDTKHEHLAFWQHILRFFSTKKRQIWIGTATHDIGPFALRIRNLQITHKIDHETNKERDYVIESLKGAKMIHRQDTIAAGRPIKFRGQTFGVNIVTDGMLEVVELKKRN